MAFYLNKAKIAGVGLPGEDGKSAYDYALESGYKDSEAKFGELLANADNRISTAQSTAESKQDKIIGTAGQFVVIGSDGNVTTKTVPSAEGVSF